MIFTIQINLNKIAPLLFSNRKFTLTTKSNCSNTVSKFFNTDKETVEKLNYNNSEKTYYCQTEQQTESNYAIRSFFSTTNNFQNNSDIIIKREKKTKFNLPKIGNVIDDRDKSFFERLENMSLESRLNNQLQIIEDKIEAKRKEKGQYIHEICELQKEINELEIDIEFLSNYLNYIDHEEKLKMEGISPITNNKKNKKDEENKFAVVSLLQVMIILN